MAKLTLQEQLLKAGLVTSKKAAKVERTAKKSRVQAREARAAVEENKKAQLERDKQLSEQQKQAALAKEYKAQVKQLIEMNRITIANGDIGFNFTDGNLIKKIFVDKLTQAQLINGRLRLPACWSITIAKVNTPLFPPALPIKLLSVMLAVLCCTARSVPKSRMKTTRMPTSKCLMI